MSTTKMSEDKRKVIRSEKEAKQQMWNHYKDNRTLYQDDIRKFRNDILFELRRKEDVVDVFSIYKKIIS